MSALLPESHNGNTRGRSALRPRSITESLASLRTDLTSVKRWGHSKWRHTLGIFLLLITVFLWTTSNFLASVRPRRLYERRMLMVIDHLCRRHILEALPRHLRQLHLFRPPPPCHTPVYSPPRAVPTARTPQSPPPTQLPIHSSKSSGCRLHRVLPQT